MKCKCGSEWMVVCPHCHQYAPPNEWINIVDCYPKLKQTVLATDGHTIAVTTFNYNEHIDEFHWDFFSSGCGCCDDSMENVTHWMPLPLPPEKHEH